MISCHEISPQSLIPYSTVRYTLLYHLKYKCSKLHLIPYSLTESQYCKQIISILQEQQQLNGDTSSLVMNVVFYHISNEFQWGPEDEDSQEGIKSNFQTQKIMVTIFWNIKGIAILNVLSTGSTMNDGTFLSAILLPFREYLQYIETKNLR